MNPGRSAVLLAFAEETEVLTKREILTRASQRDDQHLNALMAMQLIVQREWAPNAPRQYYLTARGADKRAECNVGD